VLVTKIKRISFHGGLEAIRILLQRALKDMPVYNGDARAEVRTVLLVKCKTCARFRPKLKRLDTLL